MHAPYDVALSGLCVESGVGPWGVRGAGSRSIHT